MARKNTKPAALKQFVIRKYIMANSAKDAIKKDKTSPVDDVWVDEEWKKNQSRTLPPAIGFRKESDQEEIYE